MGTKAWRKCEEAGREGAAAVGVNSGLSGYQVVGRHGEAVEVAGAGRELWSVQFGSCRAPVVVKVILHVHEGRIVACRSACYKVDPGLALASVKGAP